MTAAGQSCCSRLEATGHACHSRTVNETLLEQVVIDAINRVLCRKDDFLQTLRANIATVVLQGDALSPEVMDGTPEQAAKGAPAESQPEGRLLSPSG